MPAVVSLVEINDINAVPPGRKIAWKCSSQNLDPIMRRFDRLNPEYRCGEYSGRGEVTNSANSQVRVSVLRNAAEDGKLYLVEDANYGSDEVLNALPLVKLGAAVICVGVLGGIAHYTCLAPDFSGAVSCAFSRAGDAFSGAVSCAFSRAGDAFSGVVSFAFSRAAGPRFSIVGNGAAASSPFTTIADVGASTASNSAISNVLGRLPHRIFIVPVTIMSLLSRRPRFPGRRGSI